jgi:CRP-like cAMP-binding protein
VLFTTGEPCRGLYLVETGRVRIFRTSPSGREQVLHSEGPGRPVAELPLFDGGAYPASAITEVESRLVFLPRGEFEALYRDSPDVADSVIRELGKRLRHLVQVTETLAFRDVAARLASFLAGYAEQHGTVTPEGTEIVLDRTREELSQELGTARESVSRALKQLAAKGMIEPLPGRRMRIPDVARLRTLGRPGERARYE